MKTYSLLIITVLLCLLHAACKKDAGPGINGITAKINNVDWKSTYTNTGFASMAKKDTLIIFGSYKEQNIVIVLAQKGKGTYTANEIKANYYVTIGYDEIGRAHV